jgi:hypothetical protein
VSERRGKSPGNASVCFSRRTGGPVMICRFDKNPEYCRGGPSSLVRCARETCAKTQAGDARADGRKREVCAATTPSSSARPCSVTGSTQRWTWRGYEGRRKNKGGQPSWRCPEGWRTPTETINGQTKTPTTLSCAYLCDIFCVACFSKSPSFPAIAQF